MTTGPAPGSTLDDGLRQRLWRRVEERLAQGESLATQSRLLHALEDEYRTIIGIAASGGARADLEGMVRRICQSQPERYLAQGVQNAVEQAFVSGVRRLQWQRLTVQRHGFAAVDGFLRRRRVRTFLADIRLDPTLIDIAACVRRGESSLTQVAQGGPRSSTLAPEPAASLLPVSSEVQAAVDAGWLPMEDVQRRLRSTDGEWGLVDALAQIGSQYDQLLKHLIRHRDHVLGDGDDDRTPLLSGFTQRPALLDEAVGAIEGKDAELRLLSLRLPPYDDIGDPATQAGGMDVEEAFVSDLRSGAASQQEREPEARQLALLLLGLLGPTPLRLKVRLLMANRRLEECSAEIESCYARDASLDTARQRALGLVERRLERLGLNASMEEKSALRKRGAGLVMQVEQRWLATQGEQGDSGAEGDAEIIDDLSDHEKRNGALFTVVSIRAGTRRTQETSIVMPDPDQANRMVMGERDPESGRLVPQTRRNRRRFVDQQPDGSWQAATG